MIRVTRRVRRRGIDLPDYVSFPVKQTLQKYSSRRYVDRARAASDRARHAGIILLEHRNSLGPGELHLFMKPLAARCPEVLLQDVYESGKLTSSPDFDRQIFTGYKMRRLRIHPISFI